MCSICDGATPEELLARQHDRIQAVGFTMVWVEPHTDRPPWLYTIGLVEHDHPELAIIGLSQDVASDVVHELSHLVVDGEDFVAGDVVGFVDIPDKGQNALFRIEEVDYRLWDGDMFASWWSYYAWRGGDAPDPEALELIPWRGESFPSSLAATPLATRATRRRARGYRPLHM